MVLRGRAGQAGAGRAIDKARGLNRAQVALLLPDDRPRPHDAQPPHRLSRREAWRPHQVQRDERSRPPPTVAAVNGDGAGGCVDDVAECRGDVVRGAGAAFEGEVEMLETVRGEGAGVVVRLVEADNCAYADVLRVVNNRKG